MIVNAFHNSLFVSQFSSFIFSKIQNTSKQQLIIEYGNKIKVLKFHSNARKSERRHNQSNTNDENGSSIFNARERDILLKQVTKYPNKKTPVSKIRNKHYDIHGKHQVQQQIDPNNDCIYGTHPVLLALKSEKRKFFNIFTKIPSTDQNTQSTR